MDKITFMKELEQALSVLQKDEIKDILNEYEMHIDMKVKNGLSEDEAIADFGSLPELTADILSAYHVRADYAKEDKSSAGNGRDAGKRLEKAKDSCAKAGETAVWGLKGAGALIGGAILFWRHQLVKLLSWISHKWKTCRQRWKEHRQRSREEREQGREFGGEEVQGIVPYGFQSRGNQKKIKDMCGSAGKGIQFCFRMGAAGILWAVRLLWNMGWIGISLFFAFCGLCLLFLLGLFVVLLFQRYPLAGLTIGCFGAMVCMFSAACLGMTFLWRKNRGKEEDGEPRKEEGREPQKGEGEQYA